MGPAKPLLDDRPAAVRYPGRMDVKPQSFTILTWAPDAMTEEQRKAWLGQQFVGAVAVKGGTGPVVERIDKADEDTIRFSGWEPRQGFGLYRVDGKATPGAEQG